MEIREAQPADALAVAEVHVRSWQSGYAGLLPAERLASLSPEERAARYDFEGADPLTHVAVLGDGALAGFATSSLAAPGPGELAALYVDPPLWGRGIGGALCAAALARLAGAGRAEAVLWLFSGNERAARFYRADGWAPDGETRVETFWESFEVPIERWRRAL
jgi:GNAT superfamily N-acetyltransferase